MQIEVFGEPQCGLFGELQRGCNWRVSVGLSPPPKKINHVPTRMFIIIIAIIVEERVVPHPGRYKTDSTV